MDVIGLIGPLRSGKTIVARELETHESGIVRRLRMAGPLKEMLITLGLTRDEVDGDQKETPSDLLGGKTPRHAMQTIGTEWGRKLITDDLWANAMGALLTKGKMSGELEVVVIDDVRFANEAALIRSFGGKVWLLKRESVEPPAWKKFWITGVRWAWLQRPLSWVTGVHASEFYWMRAERDGDFDQVIYNDGNLADLVAEVWMAEKRSQG